MLKSLGIYNTQIFCSTVSLFAINNIQNPSTTGNQNSPTHTHEKTGALRAFSLHEHPRFYTGAGAEIFEDVFLRLQYRSKLGGKHRAAGVKN